MTLLWVKLYAIDIIPHHGTSELVAVVASHQHILPVVTLSVIGMYRNPTPSITWAASQPALVRY